MGMRIGNPFENVKITKPKNFGDEILSWVGAGPKRNQNTSGFGGNVGTGTQPILPPEVNPVSAASDLEMGPPGGATPLLPQISNDYQTVAEEMTPIQKALVERLTDLYDTGAGATTGLISQLQGQTRGDFGAAGSLGQQLLQQGLSRNVADVRSQLASQRGLSPAIAARLAATKQAELGGQTTQQAGILGLQQQLEAQKQLGQIAGGASTLGSEQAGKIAGQLTQADLESKRIQAGIAQANQAAQAADKARTVGLGTSLIQGGSQVAAAGVKNAAHGGRIDGVAPYAGDTPKNDVVRANLSPGEIVIPRSAAGSKKDAKSFIEALTDWDDEPSYSKVLQARQKKNYSDGGQVPFPMSGPYAPVTQEKLDAATDRPLPVAQRLKTNIDDFLTGNVVEPLAQRGYPNLGAALATVPSVAAEMMIPSTTGELQAGVIPFPGAKLTKAAKEAMKAEGKSFGLSVDELAKMYPDFYKSKAERAKINKNIEESFVKPMEELGKKFEKEKLEKTIVDKVIEPKLTESKKLLTDRERSKIRSKQAKELFTKSEDELDDIFSKSPKEEEIEKPFSNLKNLEKQFEQSDEFKELQLFQGDRQAIKSGKKGFTKRTYYDALKDFLKEKKDDAGKNYHELESRLDDLYEEMSQEDELDYFF